MPGAAKPQQSGRVTEGVRRKWRPPLGLVLGGVLPFTLCTPPAGLLAVRALTPALGFRVAALFVTGAVLVEPAVLGWLLWRLILHPLAAFAERAEAVGRGDREALARPLRHYGTRETGEVGARVLALAEELRAREASVRSFADHVTHELRAPIAAIGGAAELLEEAEGLGEADRRLVATVDEAAARMDRPLGSLREAARLRGRVFVGTARRADMVGDLPAGIAVEIVGADVDLPLSAEGLGIVLTQMLADAAEAGAGRVRLEAQAGPDGPVLLVADDGPGIAEGDRARVFDPFFTTRRRTGGTGMGLHVVRTLLEAEGGRVGADARGEGRDVPSRLRWTRSDVISA